MFIDSHYYFEDSSGELSSFFSRDTEFTWKEILICAITAGRASFRDVSYFGYRSQLEVAYRALVVFTNFQQKRRYLKAGRNFYALDPSEKGAVSYFMASALARLYAWRELDVFWMMNLDVYSSINPYAVPIDIRLVDKRIRPDLIGQNASGDWCVLEAKGRSHCVPNSLRTSSKAQAKNIKSISGVTPTHMYSLCANIGANKLRVDWIDPPEPNENGLEIKVDEDFVILASYLSIYDLMISRKPVPLIDRDERFLFVELENTMINVGISRQVWEIIEPQLRMYKNLQTKNSEELRFERNVLREKIMAALKRDDLLVSSYGGITVEIPDELLEHLSKEQEL